MTPVEDDEDTREYTVVINPEEQYSIWFTDQEIPAGWREVGFRGTRQQCLAHIDEVWTDMRPLSVRERADQADAAAPWEQPG